MLKLGGIILFFFAIVFNVQSQNVLATVMGIPMNQQDESIQKAEELTEKAWSIRKSFPDSTLLYSRQAVEIYKKAHKEELLARLYNYMGVAYYYKGENLSSHDHHVKAYQYAEQYKDSVQFGHAMNNLGRVFTDQGDFVKAYDYCFKALSTFEKIGNDDGIAYALKRIGELYLTQREYQKALDVTNRAMEIRIKEQDIGSQAYVHSDLAKIHIALGQFGDALKNYREAQSKADLVHDIVLIADINLGIAELYYSQKKHTEALKHALVARRESNKVNNSELSNRVLLILGKIYYELRMLEKAHTMFIALKDGLVNSNQLALEEQLYYYLSKIHYHKGEVTKAYELRLLYSALKDSLTNTEARKEISRIEFEAELKIRDGENEVLRARQEIDRATIEKQRTGNLALAIAIGALVLFALIALRTSAKRKKRNKELTVKNKSITEQRAQIESRNKQISKQNIELQLRNLELAELNNEKDTLMNIVAHDLKAPINRIAGMSQLLKATSLTKEQQEYVKMIDVIAKGNLNFIRDLLDVTAFEGERRKLNLSLVDLNDLLKERASQFEGDALSKNIKIILKRRTGETKIRTDKEYVSRIMDNLISNALKFSDRNNSVELAAGKEKGQPFISVKDNGPGFTEDDKKSLYKKFTKLSATPTAGENSNGLGLALVKTLVDQLGGEIELATEVGKGSEFKVKLLDMEDNPPRT